MPKRPASPEVEAKHNRKNARARQRAHRRLKAAHEEEYERYLREELQVEGVKRHGR